QQVYLRMENTLDTSGETSGKTFNTQPHGGLFYEFLIYLPSLYERNTNSHLLCSRPPYLRGCAPGAHGWLLRLALPVALPLARFRDELHRVRKSREDSQPL